jgi:tetratricopeptide (TPR) repeat protein
VRSEREQLGPDSAYAWKSQANLGAVHFELGHYRQAFDELTSACAGLKKTLGSEYDSTIICQDFLMNTEQVRHHFASAEAVGEEVVRNPRLQQVDGLMFFYAGVAADLGNAECDAGKIAAGTRRVEQALAFALAHPKQVDVLSVAAIRLALGFCELKGGLARKALASLKQGMQVTNEGPQNTLQRATGMRLLGLAEHETKDDASALGSFTEGLRIMEETHMAPDSRAETRFGLAKTYWALGNKTKALDLARKAVTEYESSEITQSPDRDALKAWLAANSAHAP